MKRKLLALLTMALMLVAMMAAAAPAGAQVGILCPEPGEGAPPCIPCPPQQAVNASPAIDRAPLSMVHCIVVPPGLAPG